MPDTIQTLAALGCTGHVDYEGLLQHDGDCPVHEEETLDALRDAARSSVGPCRDRRRSAHRMAARPVALGLARLTQPNVQAAAKRPEQGRFHVHARSRSGHVPYWLTTNPAARTCIR